MSEKTLDKDDRWRIASVACEFLALSFRYPNAELARAVSSGEWTDAAHEIAAALGIVLPDGFGRDLSERSDSGEITLSALRREATRLFVGSPNPAISPYEGVRRASKEGDESLLFVNPFAMEVARFCKACGLGRPEGTNEPLDHIATELTLLQHLAWRASGAEPHRGAPLDSELPGGSPAQAYSLFMAQHAVIWMPKLADDIIAESREPLYRNAAYLLAAYLDKTAELRPS